MNRMEWSVILVIFLMLSNLLANDVKRIYDDLDNLSIMADKVAEVNDFSFSRDIANFHLKNGKIYLLSPVNGKKAFAIFKGDGYVSITPSTEVSKERLFSEMQVTTYEGSFDFMFMAFTDSTIAEFSNSITFSDGIIYKGAADDIRYCKKYLYSTRNKSYDADLLNTLLNDEQGGYFYTHISHKSHWDKPFFFEYCPQDVEEVALGIRTKRKTAADHFRSWFCQFHKQEDYLSNEDLSYENDDLIYVDKYTIDAEITFRMDFSAICTLDFHGLQNSGKWLSLSLFDKLRINSIICENGDSLNYYKEDESSTLWVELTEKVEPDKHYNLTIDYEGDLISQGGTAVKIHSYKYWYPNYSTYESKDYDLTFHYPSSYDLVSVGNRIDYNKEKKVATARWITTYPVNYAPFYMGKFKYEQFNNPNIPTINLYLSKNLDNAKADIANSINFFQNVYDKCPFDTLTVAVIPYLFSGQEFPGLINLSKYRYWDSDAELIRSYEVAQQWWSCGVKRRNYHDIWITEVLSQFSSIWFSQTASKNKNKYFETLDIWRLIISSGHTQKRNQDKTECPVWLGTRAPARIFALKAGWIFHMLRNLMIDLNTFDETKFKVMMKDFYGTYKDSTASTEDFKFLVERHMLMDMDWFFDQWVYGNELPKFKFDYDVEQRDDGKFYVMCTIEQQNVSDDFKSYIPIEIDLGNNQKARFRTLVEGSIKEFEIPLPAKPKKINFNIFDSMLGE
jgi:hypothetical protein